MAQDQIDLTQEREKIGAQSAFDAVGNLRVAYTGLTAEDMESLRVLNGSPHWKVYRTLLERAMAEHFRASTMVTDVNGVVRMIQSSGLAAGINFSINQLQVLCAHYDAQQKKELEKSSKKPEPFRKG